VKSWITKLVRHWVSRVTETVRTKVEIWGIENPSRSRPTQSHRTPPRPSIFIILELFSALCFSSPFNLHHSWLINQWNPESPDSPLHGLHRIWNHCSPNHQFTIYLAQKEVIPTLILSLDALLLLSPWYIPWIPDAHSNKNMYIHMRFGWFFELLIWAHVGVFFKVCLYISCYSKRKEDHCEIPMWLRWCFVFIDL
jgi:hypothetical protein